VSLEVTLLRLLKYRDKYERLAKAVPKSALEVKSAVILEDFGKFFAEFPDAERIDHEPFMLWFRVFAHPGLTEEQKAFYDALLLPVFEYDCPPELEDGILERLLQAETATRVADVLQKFERGEEIDLYVALQEETQRYEAHTSRKTRVPWVDEDIGSILGDDRDDKGLHFRLECLNLCMRPLRGGDFVILAGRPDKGKTTAVASEITHMSSQFEDVYGSDHGRYTLWFNNEGPGRRIVQRVYQSALGCTLSELMQLHTSGFLMQHYAATVGAVDRIRVLDVHDFYSYEIEDILRRYPPGLVVFDMVDNIRFGGSALHGGERTDQVLEAMYQWARFMAVKYDTPIIATSQLSADAEGVTFPSQAQLKDSKTGKQGAADVIITLGASNDPIYAGSRWIGTPKNKLRRQGAPYSPQAEIIFDADRARLVMPGV